VRWPVLETAWPGSNRRVAPAGGSRSISVVVASWSGETLASACLASLAPQCADAEVIVATNAPAGSTERLRALHPTMCFLQAEPDATVFELRSMGAAAATGALVALIEDHATVAPTWVSSLIAAHRSGAQVLGGPVANGLTERAVDWALYFSEYGYHIPPVPEGPVGALSGVNIAYDRTALEACREVWSHTLQENEVNDALARMGKRPHMVPDAWVRTHLPMTLKQAAGHLFEGGRHFARYRASRSTGPKRLVWLAISPAVPLVLFGRIATQAASRSPAHLRYLALASFHLAIVLGSWGVGEALGYTEGLLGLGGADDGA
jgi:hypothetical protein